MRHERGNAIGRAAGRELGVALVLALAPLALAAQEPVAWGAHLTFSTFSIAAIDPATGETGAAVTTRVPCVGNAVPHVRAGVGAVATQASTRVEYGDELLDLLEQGVPAAEALRRRVAADSMAERRQVGVIGLKGGSAQHTGSGTSEWAGQRSGAHFVAQGNTLVGPQVIDSVAAAFQRSEGSGRHLADRLIEAIAAGQAAGGDARKGRLQSAAVVVADPRPGRARRPDQVAANINVCEHPEPVAELRRMYDTVSETLGYRTLQQFQGSDVWQLKLMLHALGYYRPDQTALERDDASQVYTPEAVEAVDRFRAEHGLSTPEIGSPPGLVDAQTLALLWAELERSGKAAPVWEQIRELTQVRR